MQLAVLNNKPALGSFGKGCPGSVALNFGRSGGKHCATACPYHPNSSSPHASPKTARCYAATLEASPRRRNLAAKLDRHEDEAPAAIAAKAEREILAMDILGNRPPWFRFSAFGSLPKNPRGKTAAAIRQLVKTVAGLGIPIHCPVESSAKARQYRALFRGIRYSGGPLDGGKIVVRQSVPNADWKKTRGACSTVGGSMERPPLSRLHESAAILSDRSGRNAVCPAVAAKYARGAAGEAHHCGRCTLCADDRIAGIVYPVHP